MKICFLDLRKVSGYHQVLQFPPINKIDIHDITEILLQMNLSVHIHMFQSFNETNWKRTYENLRNRGMEIQHKIIVSLLSWISLYNPVILINTHFVSCNILWLPLWCLSDTGTLILLFWSGSLITALQQKIFKYLYYSNFMLLVNLGRTISRTES